MRLFPRLGFAAALAFTPITVLAQDAAPAATEQALARATVTDFQSEAQLNELAAAGKTVVFFYAACAPIAALPLPNSMRASTRSTPT